MGHLQNQKECIPKAVSGREAKVCASNTMCRSCPIQKLPPFQHATPKQWLSFQRLRTANTYRRGNVIFYHGNRPLGLHFICSGRVKLIKEDRCGQPQIMRIIDAPDFLGERAFFSEKSYACTGEVMEDSRICFMEAREFWSLFGQDGRSLRVLIQRLAEKWGSAEESAHCLATCSANQRLAAQLLTLHEQAVKLNSGRSNEFVLPESRAELAESIGTKPEVVSRMISAFSAAGWISVKGRRLRILNKEGLRQASCLPDLTDQIRLSRLFCQKA